jgi:copper chaperone
VFPNTLRGYSRDVVVKEVCVSDHTYTVPKIHCAHCAATIKEEVSEVEGVEGVEVDVGEKVVTVRGSDVPDERVRAALAAAGYEAA